MDERDAVRDVNDDPDEDDDGEDLFAEGLEEYVCQSLHSPSVPSICLPYAYSAHQMR